MLILGAVLYGLGWLACSRWLYARWCRLRPEHMRISKRADIGYVSVPWPPGVLAVAAMTVALIWPGVLTVAAVRIAPQRRPSLPQGRKHP